MRYNWQHSNWPNFEYSLDTLQNTLYAYAKLSGSIIGTAKELDTVFTEDALIDLMVEEAVKTSTIEGELFNPEDIRSSIRNQLSLNVPSLHVSDKKTVALAELMIHLRNTYHLPLSQDMLFQWHKLLFPVPTSLEVGKWREGEDPMQIVSGPIGHEKVYFEAPPSSLVPEYMERFIEWFNSSLNLPGPIRAGIAHLYFESIHPFSDGNGRIGRAIAEKALSQDLGFPCVLSLSKAIFASKKHYYAELNLASQDSLDISKWLHYFVNTVYQAQCDAEKGVAFVVEKSKFWKKFTGLLNLRQEKVILRMFKEGVDGFEGGMSARKYMVIANCSKATATRDLGELLQLGCFSASGGGRSVRYDIVL